MDKKQWYKILGKDLKEVSSAKDMITEVKEYATIVFLQNSQDFNDFRGSGGRGVEGFFDSSEKEMAKFLSQWDYGEYHDTDTKKPWGTADTVTKVNVSGAGKYILTYNSGLGYAGLVKEL